MSSCVKSGVFVQGFSKAFVDKCDITGNGFAGVEALRCGTALKLTTVWANPWLRNINTRIKNQASKLFKACDWAQDGT